MDLSVNELIDEFFYSDLYVRLNQSYHYQFVGILINGKTRKCEDIFEKFYQSTLIHPELY